ncbi:MAG: histidine kinase [Saprospirales bacterium]|nr:histidine kinase [Saprospirales bacterium]
MFEDVQGTFWFCTLDDGIYGLPQNTPLNYNRSAGLPSVNLISVARGPDGRVFVGDDEGNLNIFAGGRHALQRFESLDGYNRILGILPLGEEGTWVVSDEGIIRQKNRGAWEKVPTPGSPKVLALDRGHIWCGSSAGLLDFSRHTAKLTRITDQRVTAIGKDSDGILWTGSTEGIFNAADTFDLNWGTRFPELHNRIIAIQNGGKGILWVATPESGLLKVWAANGVVRRVLKANIFLPKPIHNIHSIFREENGRLWLCTNSGLYSVRPADWHTLHFDHHDGLANDDVRAVTVFNDTLWAATAAGMTRMVLQKPEPPGRFATLITTVRFQQNDQPREYYLNDGPKPPHTTILPAKASLVEVDFAGLDYRSRGNLVFDCIITEELPPFQWATTDNLLTWIGSGFRGKTDTTRIYRSSLEFGLNMPPGKYKLRVIASTQNNVYGRLSSEWAVVMPARWYSTFWFWLLTWSIIGLGIYKIHLTHLKIQRLAFAVAQFRLVALQAQINPHFIGNAVNAVQRFFYPPSPVKASIYNATFTHLLRKTLDFSEQTFIPFETEVQFNRDYLNLALQRYGGQKFEYSISGTESIPADLPFPSLFIQPILENATIHGSVTDSISTIHIVYHRQNNYIYCTITDNGPGLNAQKTEYGWKDAKRRSRGISILRNKAATLNHLFDLDLQFSICDLSEATPPSRGTEAIISFRADKAIKAQRRQAIIDQQTLSLKQSIGYQNTS